jgi:hypothetical protein
MDWLRQRLMMLLVYSITIFSIVNHKKQTAALPFSAERRFRAGGGFIL